jgi:uncharacterized protein
MLEIRPNCENCNKDLSYNASDAMICSFECTFCEECVTSVLHNVCPNCGGGFERRPIRPNKKLARYPPKEDRHYNPVDLVQFIPLRDLNFSILPDKR